MSETAAIRAIDDSPLYEATRRRLTARQAEVVMQLVEATEVGYAGLTVRTVARRAGVAPATAYTYFGSKDHLLAEVLWRRMQFLPPVDATGARSMSECLRGPARAPIRSRSCPTAGVAASRATAH